MNDGIICLDGMVGGSDPFPQMNESSIWLHQFNCETNTDAPGI